MLVRLLGPVEVVVDGAPRTPAGKRERALVALLALTPGETVPADTVSVGLWGALLPPAGALDALVERIRADSTGPLLESGADGLRLAVDAADVDALDVERLADLAREQVGNHQPWEALHSVEQALGTWRGPVLAGVEDVPFARPAVERFTELRHTLVEERFELLFQLGRSAEAVEELRTATAEHPTRERLWGQLMTALHVQHRSQEALEVYAEARAVMADELGIEPGEALQRIEASILKGDAGRRDPALADQAVPREAARLPVPGTPTFGRDDLIDSVVRSLDDADARLVTLIGLGGSGKTRAATVAAATWRDGTGRDVHFHLVTERETADDVVAAVKAIVGELDPDAARERVAARRPRQRRRLPRRLRRGVPPARPAPHPEAPRHEPGAAAASLGADDRGAAARRTGRGGLCGRDPREPGGADVPAHRSPGRPRPGRRRARGGAGRRVPAARRRPPGPRAGRGATAARRPRGAARRASSPVSSCCAPPPRTCPSGSAPWPRPSRGATTGSATARVGCAGGS